VLAKVLKVTIPIQSNDRAKQDNLKYILTGRKLNHGMLN
jgi:hypothetical protein